MACASIPHCEAVANANTETGTKAKRKLLGTMAQRHLLTSVAGVVGVLLLGCAEPNQYQPPPPPSVSVSQPIQRTVEQFFEETGTTEAVETVLVRARVTGFLQEKRFEAGADVKKGDILYIIEPRPFEAAVAAANAELQVKQVELTTATTEYQRELQLLEKEATTDRNVTVAKAEMDGAAAAVEAAKAALDRAQLDLEYTEVRAPISGRVAKTLVKIGNLVDGTEATHLTTVISYDSIYATFNISERALLVLMKKYPDHGTDDEKQKEADKEDPAKLFLSRAGDKGFPYEGVFNYADLAVDQSTGTYLIRGLFENEKREIVPGLFVRIRVPVGVQENALLVPERAVGADQGGRYLLVVNDEDVVERHKVDVGAKHGDMVIITEGLSATDRVIIDGVQRGRPGTKVTPETKTLPDTSQALNATTEQAKPSQGSDEPSEEATPAESKAAQPESSPAKD
jgi:RND family efflux transporter MFP subunit